MPPSSKRRLLALYLDFLFFSAVFTPAAWLAERAGGPVIGPAVSFVVFALVRFGLDQFMGTSPGRWSLGISGVREPSVDGGIAARETWWTMLAGTLLVLEGSKNLVRWTQGLPPPPILGEGASEVAALSIICLLGLTNLAAGLQILRTQAIGAILGMSVVGLEAVATIVNRQAFRDWAADSVNARRSIQGLPVRDGQVEFMQDFASSYLPLVMGAGVLYLAAVASRLKRPSTAQRHCN